MPSKPETRVRKKLQRLLTLIPNTVWFSIQQITKHGDPDILGCKAGKFVALEVKATPDDKPRPLQKHKLLAIRNAGGYAEVAHAGNIAERVREIEEL